MSTDACDQSRSPVKRRGAQLTGATLALLAFMPTDAWATYSITAVNTASRQVGGAGTSCISGSSVYLIYGSAPGFGAVNSQAWANTDGRDEAVDLLEQGVAPADIIEALTAPTFDSSAEERQYGVVDLQGRAAGHTGSGTGNYADDIQGSDGVFAYSIQGNILTGPAVLTQAEDAFTTGGGCDLAERLMLALEGGAQNQEGDSRCTPDIPSDAAYIQVDLPEEPAGSYLVLEVSDTAPDNPLVELRAAFDAWRETHPCPVADPDAGATGGAGGSPVDAGTGSGGSPQDADQDDTDAPGGTSGTTPGTTTPSGEDGCGCRFVTRRDSAPWMALLSFVVVLGARRRLQSPRHGR